MQKSFLALGFAFLAVLFGYFLASNAELDKGELGDLDDVDEHPGLPVASNGSLNLLEAVQKAAVRVGGGCFLVLGVVEVDYLYKAAGKSIEGSVIGQQNLFGWQ